MLAQEYLPSYTLKDYKKWEGKWEMIKGIPYAWEYTLPAFHQCILQNVLLNLPVEFATSKGQHTTFQFDWIVSQDTVVCPDIVFVNKPIKTDDFFMTTPLVIMEIMTKNSENKDRGVKFNLYEYEGVNYYILVDAENQIFEIYELKDRFYKLVKKFGNGAFEFNLDGVKTEMLFSKNWFTTKAKKLKVASKRLKNAVSSKKVNND